MRTFVKSHIADKSESQEIDRSWGKRAYFQPASSREEKSRSILVSDSNARCSHVWQGAPIERRKKRASWALLFRNRMHVKLTPADKPCHTFLGRKSEKVCCWDKPASGSSGSLTGE